MNVYQLAALQLNLLLGKSNTAEWTATISARSCFSKCIATPGWLKEKNAGARFDSIATEDQYLWNLSNVAVQFEMRG
jgi:hypothetical protein